MQHERAGAATPGQVNGHRVEPISLHVVCSCSFATHTHSHSPTQEGTERGRASSCSRGSNPRSSSPATSASPRTSEQQLSPYAELPEHELAAAYFLADDDEDDEDDGDDEIIVPKNPSSKVSASGWERPGDG